MTLTIATRFTKIHNQRLEQMKKAKNGLSYLDRSAALTLTNEAFSQALRKEYLDAKVNDAAAQRAFDMAYEEGHANGFSEVENHYQDIAALLNLAVAGE